MGYNGYDEISDRRGSKAVCASAESSGSLSDEIFGRPPSSRDARDCKEQSYEEPAKEKEVPKPPTNQQVLAEFLYHSLLTGDKNGDGRLSRQELDALPPSSRDDNRHLREFVKDNFDTISQLNTDGTFFELGISRRDAAALFASRSVAIESARGSYVSHYSQVGADTGATIGFGVGMAAQAADLTLLGGAITETSMLMHLGAGIGYPIATKGGLDAGAIVVAPIAGAFWGPLHTSVGGYYAGQALGSRIAQNRFERVHVPKLDAFYDKIDNGFTK